MSEIRTLLGAAESAALAVETAKSGVETARQRVEEAKAELEGAKNAVETAKGELDAAYAACEEAGLPRAKAKRAVEGIIGLLAEVGVVAVAASATETAPAPRTPRKPRQQKRGDEPVADGEGATEGSDDGAVVLPSDGDEANAGRGSTETATDVAETAQTTVAAAETVSVAVGSDDEAPAPDFLQSTLDNVNSTDGSVADGAIPEGEETDAVDGSGSTDIETAVEAPVDGSEVASGDDENLGVVLGDAADLAVVDVDTPVAAAVDVPTADLPSDGVALFDDAEVTEGAGDAAEVDDTPAPPVPAPASRGFGRPSFLPTKK